MQYCRVKRRRWRWLIYSLHIFYYVIICYVFSEATTTLLSQKNKKKIHRKTSVLESLFEKVAGLFRVCFSLYPIILINTWNPIVCINHYLNIKAIILNFQSARWRGYTIFTKTKKLSKSQCKVNQLNASKYLIARPVCH